MTRQTSIQFFSLLAIVAGLLVSYLPPKENASAIWCLVSSFLGFGVRDLFGSDTPAAPPVDRQSGKSDLSLLVILAGMMALALSGCAGFQQALGGYEAAAAKGLRAAEDNNIEVLHFNLCATPFSAAVRNPDIIAAMAAWCVPNAKTSTGAALLDAAQAAQVPK